MKGFPARSPMGPLRRGIIHFLVRLLGAALVCSTSSSALAAQAYVSLTGPGGSVSQFKSPGGSPVLTFATPPGAVDILLSADGNRLYVGTTTSPQNAVAGGAPSVVAVLDAVTGALLHEYSMPASVVKMVMNAAGDHLYATGSGADGSVLVMSLDLTTGATETTAVSGTRRFDLYPIGISADGTSLFVPTTLSMAIAARDDPAAVGR